MNEFIYYDLIQNINKFIYIRIHIYMKSEITCSLIPFPYFISNPSNTLMKLAKGSGQRIISFEKEELSRN